MHKKAETVLCLIVDSGTAFKGNKCFGIHIEEMAVFFVMSVILHYCKLSPAQKINLVMFFFVKFKFPVRIQKYTCTMKTNAIHALIAKLQLCE